MCHFEFFAVFCSRPALSGRLQGDRAPWLQGIKFKMRHSRATVLPMWVTNKRLKFERWGRYGGGVPIYEFNCKACGKDAELLVASTEWKGARCPSCGSTRLAKKLSVFAAVSSGGGASSGDLPACSGNPGACGRCS